MAVVAVAGGTGDVGKTIVEELQRAARFKVIVLTRQQSQQQGARSQNSIVSVPVDYSDIASLTKKLENHAVHTVISAICMASDESSKSQLNLIQAAENARTTKRFIPSEYAHINTPELLDLDLTSQWWLDAIDCLRHTKLQYTRFANGFFMDYWGIPHVKSNLTPFTFGIDVLNCKAAIPGDGNAFLSLTYSCDLAKFVVRTLDLDEWPEFSIAVGDDITFNQMLSLAEQIRGKKFQVTYDSIERLDEGKVTALPIPKEAPFLVEDVRKYNTLLGQLTVRGIFHVPTENRLNLKFPDLRPSTFKEFLNNAWGGR